MNAFNKNSFRQKMFKCAVPIIILLQTACAANFAKLGGGPNDWTASKSSTLAANSSGAALTCSLDMPEKVSARPKVQPTTAVRSPQNAQPGRDDEEYNLPLVVETLQQTEEALQQVEEVMNVIAWWNAMPGTAKKVIAGTTITGAVIGGLAASGDESDDRDSEDVVQGVVTGAVVGAEVGIAILTSMTIGAAMIAFMVSY
jgi:hypothetical protein